jgi:hypothetical protein
MKIDQRQMFTDAVLGRKVDAAYWEGDTLVMVFISTVPTSDVPVMVEIDLSHHKMASPTRAVRHIPN